MRARVQVRPQLHEEHPQLHRVPPKEAGRIPPHHHEHESAKPELLRAEGREALPTPDRVPRTNDLSLRDLTNLKATLAPASRVPALSNLPTSQRQAKRQLERVIARKQANERPAVRPSNLNNNSKS
jgi:hypothetical protein